MAKLIIEIRKTPADPWIRFGVPMAAPKAGSLSSYEPVGRQVYEFGWVPYADHVGIWRLVGGADVEEGVLRATDGTEPREEICNLAEQHEHSMEIYSQRHGRVEVRFRLEDDAP